MKLELTPAIIDKLTNEQRKQLGLPALKDSPAVPPANLEPDIRDEPVATQKAARFNRPVNIHFHSRRKRLTDPDGASVKYVIDGLVSCGILRNDTQKEIANIRKTQEKSKTEETIITIEEA